MHHTDIVIRGAREHNLRDVNLRIPRNQLVVMTGVSGSGKSSLAFDTLYAEGQRRYVESLSSYARQFLGQMPKPEVDSISGLAPSISIQQKSSGRNPRSTVGTITEIYDYLRVLFARVGSQVCVKCGRPISAQSIDQIFERIQQLPQGTRFSILAPLIQQQKGEYRDLFDDLLKQGFVRARVDGRVVALSEAPRLDRQMKHTIEVVVDRLKAGQPSRSRLFEAIETALRLTSGTLIVSLEETSSSGPPPAPENSAESPDVGDQTRDQLYSAHYACADCGISYEAPSPQLFSFNSPLGMCPDCNGLGMRHDFVLDKLVTNPKKSLQKGAIELLGLFSKIGRWRKHLYHGVFAAIEEDLDLKPGTVLKTAWDDLPDAARQLFLYGLGDRHITFSWRHSGGIWKHGGTYDGYIPELLEAYRSARNPMRRRQLENYMQVVSCMACGGSRLNAQARHVRLQSNSPRYAERGLLTELSLPDVCGLSIDAAADFFQSLELDPTGQIVAAEVLKEIRGRLGFLLRCGLDYLTLDRTAPTLSGGESQRIRLAGQIGCGLVGVVYILDEPSIGLHPRDNLLLLDSLCQLRDQGNTVIVVEHDEDTMRKADRIIDFGPGPGVRGGEVVAEGTLPDIQQSDRSVTGMFLSGTRRIEVPAERRPIGKDQIKITGAKHHNLQDLQVEFPLGTFIAVTGVSGSGKSSLVNDILWEVLNRDVNGGNGEPGQHRVVKGLDLVDKAIDIDQSPIGRTPRSNPATYVKLFDQIRDLFTQLPESKLRGYKPGRFSFNVDDGRCEACEGHGATRLEMDFLSDVWVKCPVCEGHRFNRETLEVRYKGRNIAEVLEMDVQEALDHFANIPKIARLLQTLHDVGLDYLKLGQPSPTLSGGEAQRIKLARELGKRSTGKTIYLLDEPTTGLHFADVEMLLKVLHGFVDAGNTVVVVEHNLDVIKTADWLIDLGPEGGAGGGEIVSAGPPELIAAEPRSHTGRALAELLGISRQEIDAGEQQDGTIAADRTASFGARWQLETSSDKDDKSRRDRIVVRGASQHNLQSVDLTVPRDKISVFCGPSGSGKSSLAMDTLYAEGQRRYVESLSSYARQFLGQMPKPRVEHIHGLSPAIAIEQKSTGHTPRSTVGTVTEIYDYLRVLYARMGVPYCPDCDQPIHTQTTDEVVDRILKYPDGSRLLILAPQEVRVGQEYSTLWESLKSRGFRRVRLDGVTYRLEEIPEVDRRSRHQVEVVVDRVTIGRGARPRVADSVEAALKLAAGILRVAVCDDEAAETDWAVEPFSLHFACMSCGRSFEDLSPHNFSANSPLGWCEACQGLGTEQGTDFASLISDPRRSLRDGAVTAWPDPAKNAPFRRMLEAMGAQLKVPLDVPFDQLSAANRRVILYGSEQWITVGSDSDSGDETSPGYQFQYKGLYPAIHETSRVSYSYRQQLRDLVGDVPCTACQGSRLRDDASAVRLKGKTIQQLCELPLEESLKFLQQIRLKGSERRIGGDLLEEAVSRLSFLVNVGLHYLTLARPLPTLSGGEVQRIRLAGQIGRALTGVLYVLDEPTIGLHPRDNARLLKALAQLRDIGNTVVMVEHDREVLQAADRLYDFGPGAGRLGGQVVAEGTPKQLARSKKSLTGQYLGNREAIPIPIDRRMESNQQAPIPPADSWLELRGARKHNLRSADLRIPLGTLTCVTGVSGSGKSTLIEETLAPAVSRALRQSGGHPGPYDTLTGIEHINKLIVVDQQPLGNTPASNPATYTGVFDEIRELFARLPDAKIRGYRPARFSFNRSGGRCEECEGHGQKCIEMHFLPDVWVECETCRGKRYNRETLEVRYRSRSIADVLEMPISEAEELFDNIPRIRRYLATLSAIGLGYLTLGQSAPTLSGGEAQRVKLAAELARPNTGRTLFLLDEPTTGLHFDDIAKLLKVLNSLVEQGNTVVVIEHNLDVIKTADWVIDVGPEAGVEGGRIVAQGTPEDLVRHADQFASQSKPAKKPAKPRRKKNNTADSSPGDDPLLLPSHTGEMLRPVLADGPRAERAIFDAKQAAKKKSGDLDLKKVGQHIAMPWQKDGRRWHTVDRVGHNGNPCRWNGEALAFVIDHLAEDDDFAEPNWNHRSVVEIKSKGKAGSWFLHAMTGDEWLVTFKFRVRKKSFDAETLQKQLGLKTLNERNDLPIYGSESRISVKNSRGPWQELQLKVHDLEEIDTPGFRRFLKEVRGAFRPLVERQKLDLKELEPWKVLGRKWHVSRKGFPSAKRVQWGADLLDELLDLLQKVAAEEQFDWGSKQVVNIRQPNDAGTWAAVYTKRREGVDLWLNRPQGTVALGRIAKFAAERAIVPGRNGNEVIKLRLTDRSQLTDEFRRFLQEQYSAT